MATEREARKPLLIFGNGLQGEVENYQEGILSDEGYAMVRLEFRPTGDLMKFYGLGDDDYTRPEVRTFVIDYPKNFVRILSWGDPEHQCIFVLCDFLGRDTEMTRMHIELLNTNKLLQREIVSLKYTCARLYHDLVTSNKRYGEYAKSQLEDVFVPIIKKMRGHMQEQQPEMPGE